MTEQKIVLEQKPETRFVVLPKEGPVEKCTATLTDVFNKTSQASINITETSIDLCLDMDYLTTTTYPVTINVDIEYKPKPAEVIEEPKHTGGPPASMAKKPLKKPRPRRVQK